MSRALMLNRDADAVFFLGDGIFDLEPFAARPVPPAWLAVRGNCDISYVYGNSIAKKTDEINLMGYRIVYTHGDLYSVKSSTVHLEALARERNADLVLFGHTHTPYERYVSDYEKPFYLFNPGSIGGASPSFGVIQLTESGILLSHGRF